MSTFNCPVVRLKLETHPNADAIEIARVGDFQSIVQKGVYKDGDLAVYIPEQALVPDNILESLGLKGKLSGKDKNRVKPIRLRGVMSQGLIAPIALVTATEAFSEGEDVAVAMGIVKYEPPIPASLRGEVMAGKPELAFKFDVENFKKFPEVFQAGEPVVITEKLHGTFSLFAFVKDESLRDEEMFDGQFLVGSKGLGGQGLFFKNTVDNVYTKNLTDEMKDALNELSHLYDIGIDARMVFIIGETLGIQNGFTYGGEKFRMFGAGVVNKNGSRTYLDFTGVQNFGAVNDIEVVPVLYQGPFDKAAMIALTEGSETVSSKGEHIREGVVIYAANEGSDPLIGRRFLKYVSDTYLGKSDGEEVA